MKSELIENRIIVWSIEEYGVLRTHENFSVKDIMENQSGFQNQKLKK